MRSSQAAILSLRYSLFAALGLGLWGCGADVSTNSSGGGHGGGQSSSSGMFVGCMGATPIVLPDGTNSGYIRCDDGTIHRETAVACDTTIDAPACVGTEGFMDCKTDADCVAKPHGKCAHFDPQFGAPTDSCGCVYACAADSECGADQVCVCNGVVNNGVNWSVCSSVAHCKVDADCPTGECGITSFNDGCSQQIGLACRTVDDVCRVDSDCMMGYSCVVAPFSGNPGPTPYSCETTTCAIGRPLLVEGRARTAGTEERADWAGLDLHPSLDGLDPALREALASAWTEIAALEHASVASFARFTLSLLALGAPPDLLAKSQQAALDEVEHARIAYSLASHYAGRALGPSGLAVEDVRIETTKHQVLASLIEEACVGETLGAAEALAISQMVEDPALRQAQTRIAEDESRHAELAWKTLRFLLSNADASTRAFGRSAMRRALEAASADPSASTTRSMTSRPHGLLSASEIGSIRRSALRDVVEPLANALFSTPRAVEGRAAAPLFA